MHALEPSWFFGDGAALLNSVVAASGTASRLMPLDPVLQSVITDRHAGGDIGFRVSRDITNRLQAEVSLDYAWATIDLSNAARAGIESSRASFASTWADFLSGPGLKNVRVNAVAAYSGPQPAQEVSSTGVLNIGILSTPRFRGYGTIGGGYQVIRRATVSTTLIGNYQFTFPEVNAPFNETDTVLVRSAERDGFVGILGGGLRYFLTSRVGVRFDVRALLGPSRSSTLVDATPVAVAVGSGRAAMGTSPSNPRGQYIEFINAPASFDGQQSTLSSQLQNFETFTSRGLQRRVTMTTGLFWRF